MNPRRSKSRKHFAGTLRADRAVRAAGEQLEKCPPPAKHLSANASIEWRRLAPIIHATGVLTAADLRALELLVDTLATGTEAAEVVRQEGMTLTNAGGGSRSHPALKALETSRAQAARLLAEFGMTPKSRSYVEPAPQAGGSAAPWEY